MTLLTDLLTVQYLPFILIILIIAIASIGIALYITKKIKDMPEGTPKMKEIAQYIREGSQAYLKRQFKTILIIGSIITVALALGIDYAIHWRIGEFSMVFGAFLIGMGCSLIAGYIAMYTATNANVRTTNRIKEEGMSKALKVAFNGGMVMGLAVVGLSLLAVTIMVLVVSAVIPSTDVGVVLIEGNIIGLAFGASFAALFALLGGGIYTKAADVGADLVGKIEAGIPEDDPRNPGVIADNVGDNVGDIAGRGADLFESITGQNIATIVLAISLFIVADSTLDEPYDIYAILFPLVACSIGLIATIIGKYFVRGKDTDEPWNILVKGLYSTTIISAGFLLLICLVMFRGMGGAAWLFFGAAILGLLASLVIGIVTMYYTSERYRPVKTIADATESGPATTTIAGLSVGLESTALPVIIMIVAVLGSYFLGYAAGDMTGVISAENGGIFGTTLAALGLFSVCGMVLSLDGYGPIVDNAGGIAEMAELEAKVRDETDRLDACGNTTKAYTKGYAIATVALAAILLFEAYSEVVEREATALDLSLSNPWVLAGLLIGALLVFVFTAFALRAVGSSAQDMITEIRRQFRDIPGLKEGNEGAKPDYARCVDISTLSALKHMILPGALVIITPLIVGFSMGAEAISGLLIGSIITGIMMALFLNTGGGALDNAKKLRKKFRDKSKAETIEAYNAAIQGDLVGDPMKDTAGPSINVLLTLVLALCLQFATLFALIIY
ncbi:MAG: sodium-translocating pyrophosphatase [Candidatus Helarchaeota archaeon]|nr:sodium-translocating pyrophosphatase [Candidatus Helarchaeota archaeon]